MTTAQTHPELANSVGDVAGQGPVDTTTSPAARLRTLPFAAARITGGFWAEQQQGNRRVSLAHGHAMLEKAGNFHNLRVAAGRATGPYRGRNFYDEDLYKWLEALGWELGNGPDADLQALADDAIDLIAAAQAPNGYLDSYYQVAEPENQWTDLDHGHELYCAGHFFQAAVAFQRATGDTRLLAVARKLADHIDSVFGPGKREGTCGHPEIEMALVELHRATTEPRYLALAQFFVNQRGKGVMRGYGTLGAEYHQDHVPVREVTEAAGHAVRQTYLATGVTDLYLETGEAALAAAMDRLWADVVHTKLFITGGVGARFDGESFGDPYELPPDQCYCETCAAIGSLMWNWRLLLATGDGRYADLMEQTLYNGILASRGLDGMHYFYVNPLQVRGGKYVRLSSNEEDGTGAATGRPEWHYVACCPPNVMRMISSYGHYLATTRDARLDVHHYATATIEAHLIADGAALTGGSHVHLDLVTDYPWHGTVKAIVRETPGAPWTLALRVPRWAQGFQVEINGQAVAEPTLEQGYLLLPGTWRKGDTVTLRLPLEPRWVASNPRVDAVRGCVALQRGPIVYCFEQQDQPHGLALADAVVDPHTLPVATWQPDLLGGVTALDVAGATRTAPGWAEALYADVGSIPETITPVRLRAIPYFRWGNRGIEAMRVWMPASQA